MRIRSSLICLLVFVFSACCRSSVTTFRFLYPVKESRKVELEMAGGRQALMFAEGDTVREAVVALPLSGGEYARLWVGDMPYVVWMEAGKAWTATFRWNTWSFEGEGSAINKYLNTFHGEQIYFTDYYRIPNREFRIKLERVMEAKKVALQEANPDPAFTAWEIKRLRYIRNQHLASGVVYGELKEGKPDLLEDTRQELQKAIAEDSASWKIFEYRESIDKALLALAKMDGLQKSGADLVLDMLDMAVANYKDKRLVEYLVNKNVMNCIKTMRAEDIGKLDRIFREQVSDPQLIAIYDSLSEAKKKLMKGQAAAPFTFKDTEGNEVSLSDFRGKYVYIDLWATWCGPCVAEIPYLQKLEEHFQGGDICFVSISNDKDREMWMRYVQEGGLRGIQLHIGGDRKYLEEIRCEGIPRFLLIDKDGNYINANMTRPSDAETLKTLEKLP